MEKEYQWFDKKYKTIPEVVGLEKKEAVKLLKDFQIEYTGTGSKVLSISPESGNRILEGSKVRILLGE
ncbi:MAG: PASTA domain-containing protein [Bacilli bacterium]